MPATPVVLRTQPEIRQHVASVLGTPGRRVALVAYVGRRPLELVGSAPGLEVVCWPAPGCTSGEGVRELLNAGAKVSFSPGMHRKVYWSKAGGAIVGSANLTHAALGPNGNTEACVYFPNSSSVPIEALLGDIAVDSKSVDERLEELDAADEPADGYGAPRQRAPAFADWCAQWKAHDKGGPMPARWKLGMWDEQREFAKSAVRIAKLRYGARQPDDFISAAKGRTYSENDWVLTAKLAGAKVTSLDWLRVRFIVRVDKTDKDAFDKDYPYQAVQVVKCRKELAPFDLTARAEIRAALRSLVRKSHPEELLDLTDVFAVDCARLRRAFA